MNNFVLHSNLLNFLASTISDFHTSSRVFKPSSKIFLLTIPMQYFFVDHLFYICIVLGMLSCLYIAALWSPAGKGLTSWLLFVMFNCVFATFPCGILGQVWS